MSNISIHQQGSCTCGQSTFSVEGAPLIRFICHCQICQDIYKKPFADVVIFPEKSVKLLTTASVEFKKFRAPPAVNRGICKSCVRLNVGCTIYTLCICSCDESRGFNSAS